MFSISPDAKPRTARDATPDRRPAALGLVRADISGESAERHGAMVRKHAATLGYRYLYTVRPPRDAADPVGYALGIATGLNVAAIVVFDLAQVDNQPGPICGNFDLETVCPPTTWARVAETDSPAVDSALSDQTRPVVTRPAICANADVEAARQLMQIHRECRVDRCAWKHTAFYTLVVHGRMSPQAIGPRERAYQRGIRYPADVPHILPAEIPDTATVHRVLKGLRRLTDDPGADRP